jgi:hypothetical protein
MHMLQGDGQSTQISSLLVLNNSYTVGTLSTVEYGDWSSRTQKMADEEIEKIDTCFILYYCGRFADILYKFTRCMCLPFDIVSTWVMTNDETTLMTGKLSLKCRSASTVTEQRYFPMSTVTELREYGDWHGLYRARNI